MSASIVPFRIINIPNGIILPTPSNNMVNLYCKKGWLKIFITTELDVTLDRKLTDFINATTYTPIDSNDTVFTAFKKIGYYLENMSGQVNADWNAVTGLAEILNKPTLGTAAAADVSDFAAALHNHNLSNLSDVDNTAKAPNFIIKVKPDGIGHEYSVESGGTDEKVKYDAGDPIAGYIADKIIAGDGINVAEGTVTYENKLVITNTDKGSDVVVPTKTSDLTNDSGFITSTDVPANETDPIFSASEAANFVAGDKANLDNQSGVNTGDQSSSDFDHNSLQNSHTIPPQEGDTEDTINDNDTIHFWQILNSVWKKITWTNILFTLKTYFDTIYSTFSGSYNDLSDVPTKFTPVAHQHSDEDVELTETYTGNLAGATTQKDANDIFDSFSGGGGGASDITDLTNSSTTKTTITDSWFFQLWVSGTTWYKVTWDSIKTALTALFALKTLSNADISSLDEEATPVATDMLYLQKADGTKKKVDFDKFGGGGTPKALKLIYRKR